MKAQAAALRLAGAEVLVNELAAPQQHELWQSFRRGGEIVAWYGGHAPPSGEADLLFTLREVEGQPAQVVLAAAALTGVTETLRLGRQYLRRVRQNTRIALAGNAVAVLAAVAARPLAGEPLPELWLAASMLITLGAVAFNALRK
jgi:hypothetical protein